MKNKVQCLMINARRNSTIQQDLKEILTNFSFCRSTANDILMFIKNIARHAQKHFFKWLGLAYFNYEHSMYAVFSWTTTYSAKYTTSAATQQPHKNKYARWY